MNRIVLIDGENLIYGLRSLLDSNSKIAPRDSLNKFNYRGMVEEILSDNPPQKILWFGAKLRIYNQSEQIKAKSEEAVKNQSRFVNDLVKQDIKFVKVGYLRARETDPCINCKHQAWKLAEKGVDVGLAVSAVTEATAGNEVVIISADTDLLPAFHAARSLNAKVMYIGYEHRPIFSLAKAASSTRIISLPIVTKYLNNVKI